MWRRGSLAWGSLSSVSTSHMRGLGRGDPVVYITTEQEFRDVVEQARQLGMDFSQFSVYSIAWRKGPEELPEIVVIDIFGLLKVARQLTEKAREESPEKVRRYAALSIDTLIEAINETYEILAVAKERGTPERHVRLVIDYRQKLGRRGLPVVASSRARATAVGTSLPAAAMAGRLRLSSLAAR